MITCYTFIDLLPGYLAKELLARQRAQCRWHVGWCADCTIYLRNYQATIVLSKASFASAGPPPVTDTLAEDFVQSLLSLIPAPI